jgi:hypothetical protein
MGILIFALVFWSRSLLPWNTTGRRNFDWLKATKAFASGGSRRALPWMLGWALALRTVLRMDVPGFSSSMPGFPRHAGKSVMHGPSLSASWVGRCLSGPPPRGSSVQGQPLGQSHLSKPALKSHDAGLCPHFGVASRGENGVHFPAAAPPEQVATGSRGGRFAAWNPRPSSGPLSGSARTAAFLALPAAWLGHSLPATWCTCSQIRQRQQPWSAA